MGIAALAALVTPPDIISQFLLGIPVYILYEVSIFLVRRFEAKRAAQDAEDEDWEDEPEAEQGL